MNDLLTTADAARVLDISPDGVRWLTRNGRLPAIRTRSGVRLYFNRDVELLRDARGRRGCRRKRAGKDM